MFRKLLNRKPAKIITLIRLSIPRLTLPFFNYKIKINPFMIIGPLTPMHYMNEPQVVLVYAHPYFLIGFPNTSPPNTFLTFNVPRHQTVLPVVVARVSPVQ